MKDFFDYSLLVHNTFNIDAHCRRFVELESEDDVQVFATNLTAADHPLLIIGGGSNLLLTCDYPSTVVRSVIKGIEVMDVGDDPSNVLIRCGSGECWDDVVAYCVSHGYYGAENLSIIPGDVGASAVQNIGAYGVEVKDLIYEVEAVDLNTCKKVRIPATDCDYSYRSSRFKGEWRGRFFITYVTYRLSKEFLPRVSYGQIQERLLENGISNPTAQQLRDAIISIRNEKLPDPKIEGNAGSFFVNPVVDMAFFNLLQTKWGDIPHYIVQAKNSNNGADAVKIPAGWLIEQCGWKGKTVGRVGVHARQALVLVNRGGATGQEVLELCNNICSDVQEKFGITIRPEVNII